eukprot:Skav205965  [mRNA]  locus=scaffold442:605548:612005:+ [translate_table: standard]
MNLAAMRNSRGQSRLGRKALLAFLMLSIIASRSAVFIAPQDISRRSGLLLTLLGASAAEAAQMEPKEQVTAAMQKLEELTDPENFKKVAAGGGDNIRRQVGTVGTSSPLFDVDKAWKALAEEAEDPEAYVEVLERFTKGITRADADAYSSIFSMNSAAATSPQVYIDKAFEELKVAKAAARELTNMLKL